MNLPYAVKTLIDDVEKHNATEISAIYLVGLTIDFMNQRKRIAGFHRLKDYMDYRGWKQNLVTGNFEKHP